MDGDFARELPVKADGDVCTFSAFYGETKEYIIIITIAILRTVKCVEEPPGSVSLTRVKSIRLMVRLVPVIIVVASSTNYPRIAISNKISVVVAFLLSSGFCISRSPLSFGESWMALAA